MKLSEFTASWGMVGAYVLLNSYGALIIKQRINQLGKIELDSLARTSTYFVTLLRSPLVLSGLFAILASSAAWMIALSRMEISIAYPTAVALNFLVVITVGMTFYNEGFTVQKMVACALILAAIILLSRK
jgi:multidrug transporter EmrE-like cation transporter